MSRRAGTGLRVAKVVAVLVCVWLAVSAVLGVWIDRSLQAAGGVSPGWVAMFTAQLLLWSPWLFLGPTAFWLGRRWVQGPKGAWRWALRVIGVLGVAIALNLAFILWELVPRGVLSASAAVRGLLANGALPVLTQGFLFAMLAGIGWGHRQGELRARRERLWTEARLAALQARLRPHFLFNTLNAVSALVVRDPRKAQRMLADLGELLRRSLQGGDRSEVPLAEELAFLDTYLEIERVRCGDRLRHRRSVSVDLDTLVPPLLLQPLVENAIRHGLARDSRAGLVALTIEPRDQNQMRIRVEDDGPGPPPRPTFGIGLGTTRDRLQVLYGPEARIELGRRPGGGARAEVSLPRRTARAAAGVAR